MSLILEALRKSEAERRRGEAPTVHSELPAAPRRSRSPIARLSPVLRAVGVAFVSLLGVRMWLTQDPAPRTSIVQPPAKQPMPRPAAAPLSAPLPPVRHLTPPPVATTTAEPAKPPSPPEPSPRLANAAAATPANPPLPPPIARTASADALRLSDLDPQQRKALPPLKLSMHMWNDDPSQRFVILDGDRLREGDRIGDAVVTTITRDGVLLDWNGRRLKLSIR
jgi:general secretion pathway protein B